MLIFVPPQCLKPIVSLSPVRAFKISSKDSTAARVARGTSRDGD